MTETKPIDLPALKALAEEWFNDEPRQACVCLSCRLARGVLALLAEVERLREERDRLRKAFICAADEYHVSADERTGVPVCESCHALDVALAEPRKGE